MSTTDYSIGLDLDGVCYDFERTARWMIRRKRENEGRTIPPELLVPMSYWNSVPELCPEDWKWLFSEGIHEGLFRYGHVVGGSIDGARALSELGDVVIITARPEEAVHDTIVWLGTMFDKVRLAGIHILSYDQKKSAVRPLPDIYIDDASHNIDDIALHTPSNVRAILYDQPWNQDAVTEGRVARARGWREVVQLVRGAKEGKW